MAVTGVPSPDQGPIKPQASNEGGITAPASRWDFLKMFRKDKSPASTPEAAPNEAATKASDAFLSRLNFQGFKDHLLTAAQISGPLLMAEYLFAGILTKAQVISGEQTLALMAATVGVGFAGMTVPTIKEGIKDALQVRRSKKAEKEQDKVIRASIVKAYESKA